ncbi:bacteriohemerythrin [Marinobacterium arenosum]|uniref:bacteriohemerythrin n=1 Tax=Marinobacterium arenosum TaxID=2862496 RepID=UPI001C986E28|nr:hemerythrin domain-containing protein [Marinobacterium arenosum]MBY4676639.1 hemerythrin domain-containing protein [Marinobacterium arenosum]
MQKTSELIWQDTQHRVLFELIDQLRAQEIDASVFEKLTDYAEHHFALEEAYMRQLEYPGMDEHIAAHNKFRRELNTMLEQHHTYDEALRHSLSMFLREWLKRHVLGIDKQLERFILESKQK